MASTDKRVAELVYKLSENFSIREDGRVRCELNGHVFPQAGAYELLSKFVEGKKFQKLLEKKKAETKVQKLEPFLVRSVNFPERMWCALTKQLVAADIKTLKRHMEGRKFQNAQKRFQEDKQFLYEEPDMEADGMEEEEEEEQQQRSEGGKGAQQGGAGPSKKREVPGGAKVEPADRKGKKPMQPSEQGEPGEDDEPADFWMPDWAKRGEESEDGEDDEGEGTAEGPSKASAKGRRKPHAGAGKKAKREDGPRPEQRQQQQQQQRPGGDKSKKRRNPNKHPAKRVRNASS